MDNEKFHCSICISDDDSTPITKLECNHTFHIKCINKWWNTGSIKCPLCLTDQQHIKIKRDEIIRRQHRFCIITENIYFRVLEPIVYCSEPNLDTQLLISHESTVLPETVIIGRIVEGSEFIRTIVNDYVLGYVYCYLPIYSNNRLNLEEIIRNKKKCCSCF